MKRKVIKQGHNTLTITLPSKWCNKNNISSGNELEIAEIKNILNISSSEKIKQNPFKQVDISNMDRCSILYTIRNLYRLGYDQIELFFKNKNTTYYRIKKELPILEVVKYEVNNLVGVEIIEYSQDRVIIKDISNTNPEDFENLLRRVFLILKECGNDLIEGLNKKDISLIRSIKEKHDISTKFISYCLRMLNKDNNIKVSRKEILYHIISMLDKIADIYKNVSRDVIDIENKFNKSVINYIKKVVYSLEKYEKLFYKSDKKHMIELNMIRDNLRRNLKKDMLNFTIQEIIIIRDMMQILDIIAEMIVARIGLDL